MSDADKIADELAKEKKRRTLAEKDLEEKSRQLYIQVQKAQQKAEKLQSIFDSFPDPIFVTDAEHCILECNPSAYNTFGFNAEECLFSNLENYFEDPSTLKKSIAELNESTVTAIFNGKDYIAPVMISAAEIPGDSSSKQLVFYLKDITLRQEVDEEKEAEKLELDALVKKRTEQLDTEKNKAEAANAAKNLFLANISHEIRTPLHAIVALSSLMDRHSLDSEQKARLHKIMISSSALLALVNDVLDLSKIEAGQLSLEEIPFLLPQVLHDSLAMFEDAAREKGIQLIADLEVIESLWCLGDPMRLRQVLVNLIGNAIKFTEKGSVTVCVILLEQSETSLRLEVEITDTGIGIEKENLSELFKPFNQGDISTTRRFGGTGLGLSICRSIVYLMHGDIHVQSELGKGSTFRFNFLSKRASEKQIKDNSSSGSQPIPQQRHLNTLVIEDNSMNRDVMELLLTELGHKVTLAEDGAVGFHKFKEASFDIILMDCQMPVMDGYEATRQIRQWEKLKGLKETPIVAMTANALGRDRDLALRVGMNHYVTKPIDISTLGALLSDLSFTQEDMQKGTEEVKAPVSGAISAAALALLRKLSGPKNPDFMKKQIASFELEYPKVADELTAALQISDFKMIKESAHRFKSSTGIVGAVLLTESCEKMEAAALASDIKACKSAFLSIKGGFVAAQSELLKELKKDA